MDEFTRKCFSESPLSIWGQIHTMVESHIFFKAFLSLEKKSDDVSMCKNRLLRNTLERGYINTQALCVRTLTQQPEGRNKPLSIPALINHLESTGASKKYEGLPEKTIFQNNVVICEIKNFTDQFIAHVDRSRKTGIKDLNCYMVKLEYCHQMIIFNASTLYSKIYKADHCLFRGYTQLTDFTENFCSKEAAEEARDFQYQLEDRYNEFRLAKANNI